MASSLASIAETWPENVLTSIVSRNSHCVRKIIARPYSDILGAGGYFLRICAIFCRYWTCTFSGRNNQAIGTRLSAIFTFFFTMQSYGKEIWHCPLLSGKVRFCPHFFYAAKLRKRNLALSSFVQLCPFMSSYDIASLFIYVAKLRNRNLAMSKFVQFCPLNF